MQKSWPWVSGPIIPLQPEVLNLQAGQASLPQADLIQAISPRTKRVELSLRASKVSPQLWPKRNQAAG